MPFAAMPPVPMTGLDSFIASFMLATKQNVELLTGQYGDLNLRAVVRGQVSLTPVTMTLTGVSARGDGVSISGTDVPTLADYQELVRTVQLLANDLSSTVSTLNALMASMKG